jgi:hypothetical protein
VDLVRLLADDLVALLKAEAPPLIAGSTPEEWHRAHLFGRTTTGLPGYHYWMADASPGRLARLLGLPASMMAANLDAALDRGPVLVHAHNALLRRDKATMRLSDLSADWWSTGAIVGARLGDGYAFLPTALGTIHHGFGGPRLRTPSMGCSTPSPRTGTWSTPAGLPRFLGDVTPVPRVSSWFDYARWTRPTWRAAPRPCSSRTAPPGEGCPGSRVSPPVPDRAAIVHGGTGDVHRQPPGSATTAISSDHQE